MTITWNQNSNLNGIGAALINHNQMTLGGQTKRPCMTDRVSKLKSCQFLKCSAYNVETLSRPWRLHQLTSWWKAINLDVAIQEQRWLANEETVTLKNRWMQLRIQRSSRKISARYWMDDHWKYRKTYFKHQNNM